MNLNQKNWGCPKKLKARQETILDFYRKAFKRESVPTGKQYWTICGQCSVGNGKPIQGCEYDQVTSFKFAKPCQFHGVEIVPEIHNANTTIKGTHWHLGDFYQEMVSQDNLGTFDPAIVNADLLMMPENGSGYLSRIVAFLTAINISGVMVVSNVILRQRQHRFTNDDTIRFLSEDPQFKYALDIGKWKIYPLGYVYNGTGNNKTIMGTVVIFNVVK
jgi:hypothetical protein